MRIALLKLICNFLSGTSPELASEIVEHDLMEHATDLFFKYIWNSVIHGLYTEIVKLIIESDSH